MKKLSFLFLVIIILLTGCNSISNQESIIKANNDHNQERFEVIYEHDQTQNLGGFSVIKDNKTDKEYLVVSGLNGSIAVVPLYIKDDD